MIFNRLSNQMSFRIGMFFGIIRIWKSFICAKNDILSSHKLVICIKHIFDEIILTSILRMNILALET